VTLDASVGRRLTPSEGQHVLIVDIGKFDLITALARCRVNFASACDFFEGLRGAKRVSSRTPKDGSLHRQDDKQIPSQRRLPIREIEKNVRERVKVDNGGSASDCRSLGA
jgi:hypothetical protein